ncbi:MAG: putative selenate ABC transporter substrate-binding protein [Myxococcales bacterium]|nr:putative selenate ABC transporter substrate-binding protein [Myxococcales bacterium]
MITPLTVLLTLGCTSGGEHATEPAPLRFSAIPDQNTSLLRERFEPVAAFLSDALGVPVQYVPAADYGASVEMFKNGDVQLAWFGGLTGVQARAAVPGAKAIAAGAEDKQYTSYFIAHASTGLERGDAFPEAIASLTFTFGSESSTSGRLMPEFFIRQHTGKTPGDFFSEPYGFSGAHDKTAKLVESGRVLAGAMNYKTYDDLAADGRLDPTKAVVIWQTPTYADYNFTAHPVLEERYGAGFTEKLTGILTGITAPTLLDAFSRSALVPATDADFAQVAEVARELDMLR